MKRKRHTMLGDMYLISQGMDYEAMREERKEETRMEKESICVLKSSTKNIVRILAVIYVPICAMTIKMLKANNNYLGIFIQFLLLLMAAASAVLVSIKTKKTEIFGICLFVGFFIGCTFYLML